MERNLKLVLFSSAHSSGQLGIVLGERIELWPKG